MKIPANDLAGGYLSTAESKIAPLLVSGSWVGWLMKELSMMLPARFKYKFLKGMPENEAAEMLYKYSNFFEVPVTEETAYLLIKLTEGSPFYISAVLRSNYPDKDLTTIDGLSRTLEFETLDDEGTIKITWMEYILSAFPRINDQNAKKIVLHLSKHRDREWTRKELINELNLEMTDSELEKKLKALVKADIISQGQTNFDYRGVGDNIFDKVFRGVYEKEIREFDVKVIKKEYIESLEKMKRQYRRLQGKYHSQRGYFAEYLILDQLKYRARKNNELFKTITRYLPRDFKFCDYSRVWRYDSSPEYSRSFSVDIFARAVRTEDYSLICEVKSRQVKKFSKEEVIIFERKLAEVKKYENIERAVGFIYSRCGFTAEAEEYCKEKGIACSDDEKWLL
jgi:Fe-S cluster biosynthesis and repair protein YggX